MGRHHWDAAPAPCGDHGGNLLVAENLDPLRAAVVRTPEKCHPHGWGGERDALGGGHEAPRVDVGQGGDPVEKWVEVAADVPALTAKGD